MSGALAAGRTPRGRRTVLLANTDERRGGAAQVAVNLLEAYRALGWSSYLAVGRRASGRPDVVALSPGGGRGGISGVLHRVADKVVGLGRTLDRLRGVESFRYPASRRLLELSPEPPDLIHLHNLHGGYFDLRVLSDLGRRLPVVLTLHDAWMLSGHCAHSFGCERWVTGCGECPDLTIYPAVRKDRTALNWERKRTIYRASRLRVTTPSKWLMRKVERSMLREGIVESRVIPNGVDLALFRPTGREGPRRALGIEGRALVLLFVASGGVHDPFKDYALLRSAVARVAARTEGRGVVFLALGAEGPRERVGDAEIRHLPFQERTEDVARCYQAADLVLHAVKADTFPNTVLEALACGTPVVATAVGGIPEQIRSLGTEDRPEPSQGGRDSSPALGPDRWPAHDPSTATGILTPPGDAESMADAVLRLLGNAPLRDLIGENAVRDARGRFGLDRQARAYVDWFEAILDARSGDGGERPARARG